MMTRNPNPMTPALKPPPPVQMGTPPPPVAKGVPAQPAVMGTTPARANPMGTTPARANPMGTTPARANPTAAMYAGYKNNPKNNRPFNPYKGKPFQHPPLNWQQQQMQQMPEGMKQMYNGRPMQPGQGAAPPQPLEKTMRGQPAGSRVNLQRNQLLRGGY